MTLNMTLKKWRKKSLDDNSIVLWVAVAALMFGGGFLFIFFFGSSVDYTVPGTEIETGDWLRDNLPKWMFPPQR